MSSYRHIRFSIEDRVGRITLARAPLNVLNIQMMREIGAALEECAGEREMVAVVFDAERDARAFSAGVAIEEHVAETIYQMLESFHNIFRALDAMAKPVELGEFISAVAEAAQNNHLNLVNRKS